MRTIERRGATGVAYGLVVGLIAIVALGAITGIGENVDGLFGTVSDEMNDVVVNAQPSPSQSPAAAALTAAPDTVSNGDVSGPATPSTSTPIVVTFTNTGGSTTGTLSTLESSGNFPVTSDDCNGNTLAASASCDVTVTPTASANGSLNGQITVGDGVVSAVANFSGTASGFSDTGCAEILSNNPSATSGTYAIDPDGAGGDPAVNVLCDMTTEGGGWTRVFVYPNSSTTYSTNVWAGDYQTNFLTANNQFAHIAMSKFSSTSTGHDLEIMWETENTPRRIYRNLPLNQIFNGSGSENFSVNAETKLIGGNWFALVDSTSGKGGWYYGLYDNASDTTPPLGYRTCGWLLGNGSLHGLSTSATCQSSGGYSYQGNVLVEIWVR